VAVFISGGVVRWKFQYGATGSLLPVAVVVMSVLVPSARPDEGPKKGESTCVDRGKGGKEDIPGGCEDSRKNATAHLSIEKEKVKKRNLLRGWLDLGEQMQTTQPDWLSPLATTSGRLKQEFRFDIWDQPASGGNRNYQFGGGKGLEFITSSRTQILIGVPAYTLMSPNGPPGGFGDLPLMLKFRISSAERTGGNYLVTFILAANAPTGSHRYGAGDAVVTPTMAFGKGWRRFDVQSTLGINLPAGNTAKLGRQVLWNTAFQYRAAWKLWPELEANSTFYTAGKNAGETQLFLTPGLGFGRAHLSGRFRFSSAVGVQIAATHFRSYNHRWMFSTRVSF
jgi:hypothetical protein